MKHAGVFPRNTQRHLHFSSVKDCSKAETGGYRWGLSRASPEPAWPSICMSNTRTKGKTTLMKRGGWQLEAEKLCQDRRTELTHRRDCMGLKITDGEIQWGKKSGKSCPRRLIKLLYATRNFNNWKWGENCADHEVTVIQPQANSF